MVQVKRIAALAALSIIPALLSAQGLNTAAIDQALGRSGQRQGAVYRLSFPRTDLHVTLHGVAIKPGLALGSWAAFMGSEDHAMVMGDLCLLPSEVNPVMKSLRHGGYEIMALHNHLLFESPHVMFLHYMGQGDAAGLARALHAALALSRTPLGRPARSAEPSSAPAWVKAVESALNRKGNWKGGVLAFGVPRAEAVTVSGVAIPPAMGVAESMNFQDAGGGQVATTGDFVLTGDEVNPVIAALEQNQIDVTALHSHMLGDQPRLFFMHFWSVGAPRKVAAGLRDALAHVKTQ